MSESERTPEVENLLNQIKVAFCKFNRACHQMSALDERIRDTQIRYQRALVSRDSRYWFILQQRLVVLRGVRAMFYRYARRKVDEMDDMRDQVQDQLSSAGESFIM